VPRSFANYLTYINGEPFLGRLKVLAQAPAAPAFPQVPLMNWDKFNFFVNGSSETNDRYTIRTQMFAPGIEVTPNVVADDSGSNGRWITFWDTTVVQTDIFGFQWPMFATDITRVAHGPGNLATVFYIAVFGWGTASTE
jgi:hypothetical protein